MREGNFIEETESKETSLEQFVLTEKGKDLLKESDEEREVFRKKFHVIRKIWMKIYRDVDEDLYRSGAKLFEAIEGITLPKGKGSEQRGEATSNPPKSG